MIKNEIRAHLGTSNQTPLILIASIYSYSDLVVATQYAKQNSHVKITMLNLSCIIIFTSQE